MTKIPSLIGAYAIFFSLQLLTAVLLLKPQLAFSFLNSDSGSTIYYDADEINLDKKTGNMKAQGNAFLLIGNLFVSAHRVQYDKQLNLLTAEGSVRIVRKRERISASRVLLNETSGEARMDDVEIYADPTDTDAKVNEEVLGFSKAELAFEMARRAREQELIRQLESLRIESLNQSLSSDPAGQKTQNEIIRKYSRILERLIRTRHQPNDVLRDLPEDARSKIESRREAVRSFASKDPQLAQRLAGLQQVPGFLTLRAERVYQNSDQTLDVEYAAITTCRCDPNERPAWGLSASRARVEPNEYITLYGATLEVSSFPLVFTPWFKMPIKTKRQAGFLLPSLYFSRSGDAVSIPYFMPFGDSADSTLTYTQFSKRGPRGEIELRMAVTEDNKHNLKFEALNERNSDGVGHTLRWGGTAQSNLPLPHNLSLKVNIDKASDQRYYADLTKEPDSTQDLFTPQLVIKRFLNQQVALEHNSDSYSFGLEIQSPQDVFLNDLLSTPRRQPRIEFNVFPRLIGRTRLIFDLQSDFERIKQSRIPADVRQSLDVRGERWSTAARINYPVRDHKIFNSNIGLELATIHYKQRTARGSLLFPVSTLEIDVPMYSEFAFSKNELSHSKFRHSIAPFSKIRWIPSVQRTGLYPDIYSTYYSADNIARSQTLHFGFNSSVQFIEEEFQPIQNAYESGDAAGQKKYSPAGQESLLFALLGFNGDRRSPAAGDYLFASSQLQNNPEPVFQQWATQELEQYRTERLETFTPNSQQTLAISNQSWRRATTTHAHFFQLNVSTSFNFEAKKTAEDQNKNLRPGQIPVSPDPWGDISTSASISAEPWIPVGSSFVQHWKPSWNRYRERTAALELKGRHGIHLNLTHSRIYSEALDASGTKYFPAEQLWGVDFNYQPKSWIRFQYQHRRNIKPQPAESAELEYSALQKLSFLGIQDCVDIILQRFKDRGVQERMATWTLGLNLNFLGQQRPIETLGKVVDRAIKSQLNR